MANQQNLSRRAAMRQQQELEEKQKRRNRVLGIGAGILALALVAVIAIVAIPPLLRGEPEVTAEQLTPPNATAEHGILISDEPTDDKPHVVIYQDFRCPACASNDASYGPIMDGLVEAGEITLEYHTTYFLDEGSNGDASARAAMAAAAADEVGFYEPYRKVVYANQSNNFTEQQLSEDFPQQAGIEGEDLERFQELYSTRAFRDFAVAANQAFYDNNIGSTPTYQIGDRRLVFGDQETQEVFIQNTEESLLDAITKAYNSEDDRSNEPLAG